ncbi:MAG: DNA alkylation repair protein, partial [Bacteroidetes bacterium]|nr:DNA alkylation repair protein [Bacteroidota bacterium]
NLNDISKDHPQLVIDIAKQWMGQTKETDWVVKHAARTLLKAGNQEMMRLFGYGASEELKIENFKIENPDVNLGEYLTFHFDIKNTCRQPVRVRLEYAIYFLIKSGKYSKKVFKISEKEYEANSTTPIERKQHFKPITTRVYYSGVHKVAPIINGVEGKSFEFGLKV